MQPRATDVASSRHSVSARARRVYPLQNSSNPSMKTVSKMAGTRGAHRQKARQVYVTMSAEDREDWRYQMAEMRLQAEMQDRECAVKVDLAATDPSLPLTIRWKFFSTFHFHTRAFDFCAQFVGTLARAGERMRGTGSRLTRVCW